MAEALPHKRKIGNLGPFYGEPLAKVDWRGFATDSGREQFHFGSPFRPND
jgi:hypothetical protein